MKDYELVLCLVGLMCMIVIPEMVDSIAGDYLRNTICKPYNLTINSSLTTELPEGTNGTYYPCTRWFKYKKDKKEVYSVFNIVHKPILLELNGTGEWID